MRAPGQPRPAMSTGKKGWPRRPFPTFQRGEDAITQTENLCRCLFYFKYKTYQFHVPMDRDIVLCTIKYNLQKILSSKPKETHLIFTFV